MKLTLLKILPNDDNEVDEFTIWYNTLKKIIAEGGSDRRLKISVDTPQSIKRLARRLLLCNYMFKNKQVGVTHNQQNNCIVFLILSNGKIELSLAFDVKNAHKKFKKVKSQCDAYYKTIEKIENAIESGQRVFYMD